jgi:PPOX class probable F420-dependent enzyme
MGHRMSETEVRSFLMGDPAHTGKLATTRQDGSPHVAPIWYTVDGSGDILFNTGETTLKGRTLRRDPRCSMCVDDERPPFTFVIVNGTAELIDDLDQIRHWAGVIAGRYMGAAQADAYGERNGVPGELLVRLHPTNIVSERGVAD